MFCQMKLMLLPDWKILYIMFCTRQIFFTVVTWLEERYYLYQLHRTRIRIVDTSLHLFIDSLFNDFDEISFRVRCFPTSCSKPVFSRTFLGWIDIPLCMATPQWQEYSSSWSISKWWSCDCHVFHVFCFQELQGILCLVIVVHSFRPRTEIMIRCHHQVVQ